MPCRTYEPEDAYRNLAVDANQLRAELDLVTRLLCTTLGYWDGPNPELKILGDTELQKWWHDHQIADAKRKADEEKARLKELESLEKEAKTLREKQEKIKARLIALNAGDA